MDEGVAQGDAHLDALRRRVYAPGATSEVVREYAAALALRAAPPPREAAEEAAAPAAPESPVPVAHRSRWASGAAIAGLVAVAAVAAALTAHPSADRTAPRSAAGAAAATALPPPPPVPGPVLATLSSVGASASASADLDAKGHTVVLASLCNGDGTVTVQMGDGSTTVLACAPGMPALVMVESTKALGRFTVRIRSEGHPQWTLTIGTLDEPVT